MAFFGILFLTASDLLVYDSGQVYHPLMVVFWNSVVLSLLGICCILITKSSVSQPNFENKIMLLTITGMLKGCGDIALTCANIFSTPGNAIAILYTMPILTIIFSIAFLGDKCHVRDIVLALFAVTGVFFIAESKFISRLFSSSDAKTVSEESISGNYHHLLGILLALGSSAMNAAALVFGRYVGEYDVSPLFILLLIGLLENGFTIILCSLLDLWTFPVSLYSLLKVVSIGFSGFVGLLAMFFAVANERPTLVSIVLSFQVVFIFVGQYFLFGVGASWVNAIGVTFLVSACVGASMTAGNDTSQWRSADNVKEEVRHLREDDGLLQTEKQQ